MPKESKEIEAIHGRRSTNLTSGPRNREPECDTDGKDTLASFMREGFPADTNLIC
jgi:hypothetical protein